MNSADRLRTRFEAFVAALDAASPVKRLVGWNFRADLRGGATVAAAVLDSLQEQYVLPERDPETGCPTGYRPIEVPESLLAERDALLTLAADVQELEAKVADAEPRAVCDTNP